MLQPDQVDELICFVASLDRPALIRCIRNYPATFPVDFNNDFFERTSLDRIRHIFVAMCLHCQHMPRDCGATLVA